MVGTPYPNKWMEERNLRSLHNATARANSSVIPHISNKAYLEICKTLIKPEQIWKLLKWIDGIDEHKKGLKLLN